ncbi:MAG: HNH endonuclease [Myxococcota bacterium]|nr:HNH endonuclease [Myxococcota bacterium]
MTVCSRCNQGHQEGSGAQIAVDAAAVERAFCDAQHIGSTSDSTPVRATQDIPPSIVRFVWRRDGGRCQTPGCRSARGLECHHKIPRADGGTHDPSNLHLLCSACHMATHRGTLVVDGDQVLRPNAPPANPEVPSHVGSRLDDAIVRTQARDALVGLGWKPNIARAAVEEALSHVGRDPALEELIREALRRCPRPGG